MRQSTILTYVPWFLGNSPISLCVVLHMPVYMFTFTYYVMCITPFYFVFISTCISLVHKDSGNIFILIQATRKLCDCPFLYLINPFELLIINFRYMIFTNTCKTVLQISRFFAMVGLLLKLLIYNYRIYYRLQLFLKYYVFSTV